MMSQHGPELPAARQRTAAADLPAVAKRCVIVFITLGVAWRLLRYALCFPFWGDEAYINLSILHRGYRELLDPLEYSQVAPLLFLWIQRAAYTMLGGGEYALRAFPLLAGLAALAIFCRLAWRELEPRSAAIAIGIFAGTYALVRHTCEGKPYAGDLLAATLLVWLGARWLRNLRDPAGPSAASLAVIPLVWLSYPSVFVAGGISLTLLAVLVVNRRESSRRAWLWWAAYSAVTVASFLLLFFLFAAPHVTRATGSWLAEYWRDAFPPLSNPLRLLWWLVTTHTGPMLAYPVGGQHFGSALTTLLCLAGVLWLVRRRRLGTTLLCLAPALPTFIAAAMHYYPYGGSVRVAIHFAPAICLLAGAGAGALVDRVSAPRRRAAVGGAIVVLLMVLPVVGAVRDVLQPYKSPEDAAMRRVMREVADVIMAAQSRGHATLVRPGVNVAIYNAPEGTHGSPDGPVFHQSLRYYLELYSGIRPDWRTEGNLGPGVNLLLVYRGSEFGPSPARVAEVAAQAGLRITSETAYSLSSRSPASLIVCECAPAP